MSNVKLSYRTEKKPSPQKLQFIDINLKHRSVVFTLLTWKVICAHSPDSHWCSIKKIGQKALEDKKWFKKFDRGFCASISARDTEAEMCVFNKLLHNNVPLDHN